MTKTQTPQTITTKVRNINDLMCQAPQSINGKRIYSVVPQRRRMFRVVLIDGTSQTLRGTETLELDA